MSRPHYSLMINWSEEDQVYIACVPEFGEGAKTHGNTYIEAAQMGEELIESLILWAQQENQPLPQPLLFDPEANYAPNPFDRLAPAWQKGK